MFMFLKIKKNSIISSCLSTQSVGKHNYFLLKCFPKNHVIFYSEITSEDVSDLLRWDQILSMETSDILSPKVPQINVYIHKS